MTYGLDDVANEHGSRSGHALGPRTYLRLVRRRVLRIKTEESPQRRPHRGREAQERARHQRRSATSRCRPPSTRLRIKLAPDILEEHERPRLLVPRDVGSSPATCNARNVEDRRSDQEGVVAD